MPGPASVCASDDTMLAFVEGGLSAARRREVVLHLDGCTSCQGLAAELAREHEAGAVPDEPAPAAVVSGRFVLGEALGKGAMATVFRAHDRTLGVDVALKLLRRTGASDHAALFRREVEIGRKVTHPNVCRLYDAGSTADHDYITMELVDGDTLAHVLARDGVTTERAVEILTQVSAGLAAAHALGIVHRDLKPANVMIERGTGRAVITDFGFATDLDAAQSRRLVGTPSYWAPEQARGESPAPAFDVYALGVLAYRLFTGRELTTSDPDALADVPARYRRVVARCVEPRPSARYPEAGQVRAALVAAGARRSRWPWVVVPAAMAAVILVTTRPWTAPAHASHEPSVPAVALAPSSTIVSVPSFATAIPSNDLVPAASTAPIASGPPAPVASPTRLPAPPTAHAALVSSSAAGTASAARPSGSAAPADPDDLLYRR